jgi:phosphohistidine phosphatase
MKKLLLVRHAKSGWQTDVKVDFDRKLTKQGSDEAIEMAALMSRNISKLDKIITSPAVRAVATEQHFASAFNINFADIQKDTGLYEKGVPYIKKLIASQDVSLECIMLVGHNPIFTTLTSNLTGEEIPSLEACSVVCINYNITKWSELEKTKGQLIFIEAPFII